MVRINGPVNAMRMEGTIDGEKKVLYLFMDIHEDLYFQTQCDDVRADEFKKYLVDNFDNLKDRKVDFFLEVRPQTLAKTESTSFKSIYLSNIRDLFRRSIDYDVEKNQMGVSKQFPNVRFHYIDFRWEYWAIDDMHIMADLETRLFREMCINLPCLNQLSDGLNILGGNMITLLKSIKNPIEMEKGIPNIGKNFESISRYSHEDLIKKGKELYYKTFANYKNKNLQKLIEKFRDSELTTMFTNFFKTLDKLINFINQIKSRIVPEDVLVVDDVVVSYGVPPKTKNDWMTILRNLFIDLKNAHLNCASLIVDCYFLRRFLDKEYVDHGIIYGGIAHSVNYVYFLTKYLGFKITHHSYLKVEPTELESIIKKIDDPRILDQYVFPPTLVQCSNLGTFPKLFK